MDSDKAAISVFGLGYVGCVSAACFAARGHSVIGVDANPQKTQFIRDGVAPIVEDRIAELTTHVVSDGLLTVADDPITAVLESDISLICVGTPSTSGGGLSTEAIGARERSDRCGVGHQGWLARHRIPQHDGAWNVQECSRPSA